MTVTVVGRHLRTPWNPEEAPATEAAPPAAAAAAPAAERTGHRLPPVNPIVEVDLRSGTL